MPYYAITRSIRERYLHDLTDKEFKDLKDSRDVLIGIASFESSYAMLCANYDEFASACEKVRGSLPHLSWHAAVELNVLFNRRLTNYLTTVQQYKDHTPRHLSWVKGQVKPVFDAKTRPELDALLLLRDHTQHFDLPIQKFVVGRRLSQTGDPSDLLELRMDRTTLETYKGRTRRNAKRKEWPEHFLAEAHPDLVPTIERGHKTLAEVHGEIREFISDGAHQACRQWSNWLERLSESNSEPLSYFVVIEAIDAPRDGAQFCFHSDKTRLDYIERFTVLRDLVARLVDLGGYGRSERDSQADIERR